jgi:SAM-dependent methyltransferase
MDSFDQLITEAEQAHFSGWDFSFLDGRWDEEDPPWDYRQIVTTYLPEARSLLDMGTGGGEFLSSLPGLPAHTCATEGYAPNLPLARARLEPLGVRVFDFSDPDNLPFAAGTFDLVINRHESFNAPELQRILMPGGRFITQQVGGRDNIDLNEQLEAGADPEFLHWQLAIAAGELEAAGFRIIDQAEALPRTRFHDIGAVVYYLKVISWQIPDFTVEKYLDRLRKIHDLIVAGVLLTTHSHRFFIHAVKE